MVKKIGFFLTMLLVSSLYIIGCGGSSNGSNDENINVDSYPWIQYDTPTVVVVGSTFDPLAGVTAGDDEDGDLTGEIEVTGSVNVSEEGTYTITYTVTDSDGQTTTAERVVKVIAEADEPGTNPVDSNDLIEGTALGCTPSNTDGNVSNDGSSDANETTADEPFKRNISTQSIDDIESRKLQTSHNTPAMLDMVMAETGADGAEKSQTEYHPIVVSYLEHVAGSDYETGDGSADIGDPDNLDKVMVSLSRDNGQTWKDYNISNTSQKSSIEVVWDGQTIEYPGDAQKPTMAVSGNHVVVAWNDKYCPSGNPFDLEGNSTVGYPDDAMAVNGPQGFIDYEGIVAPNGKTVYQVPFSCVWTARGIINEESGEVTWHAPVQLTSGTRDSNHIWVEGSDAGFAMTWQEDTAGLKAGEGAGPGEGWSGATGNRGTDIWYTSIKAEDFEATGEPDTDTGKLKSANNFHYPVRITDNEQCKETDRKPYCEYFCTNYGTVTSPKGNQSGDTVTRCLTYDTDMLTDSVSILDGDTGASRPALKILKTNVEGEYVVVLGYEETKALKERITGEGEQDQGEVPTDIAVEGKSVYFESFDFNAINAFDESNLSTITNTAMPIVSAGNIINVKVPRSDTTEVGIPGEMIYENARRLVIGTQIDSCDANESADMTFAILYKQSFEVQGSSSDMFVRVNYGFTYDSFGTLTDANLAEPLDVSNVSAQYLTTTDDPALYQVSWNPENLNDYSYENPRENTFSPRIFLRGENIYVGFEYTPYETMDGEQLPLEGLFPSNFHTNIYMNGAWQGPVNITQVTDSSTSTVDARFFTTPKGSYDTTGLESDKSNPDVLFVTWGTIFKGTEADLFFKRSTDNGASWEEEQNLSSVSTTLVQEKEVESFASPDGKHIYNFWLQETEMEPGEESSINYGLDSWFGRVDYNITAP
ncbi:DUF5011 domain-containing protein [Sulfurovum mangrovi]|uniref:DUF5011 domain-containing protein n=1 Tax=Sulfurovum mangrovi TaxID=2893889 RepID=UPI001E61B90E|nr:DUF5011 domain-containing protein [Sulfurovum mangrovi]UFH58174.1 DUF5011 domain-containing protein [Sulfurovum mangrovi]